MAISAAKDSLFPNEIIVRILSELPQQDIVHARAVSFFYDQSLRPAEQVVTRLFPAYCRSVKHGVASLKSLCPYSILSGHSFMAQNHSGFLLRLA